jgi:HAMP domain-containing protein
MPFPPGGGSRERNLATPAAIQRAADVDFPARLGRRGDVGHDLSQGQPSAPRLAKPSKIPAEDE